MNLSKRFLIVFLLFAFLVVVFLWRQRSASTYRGPAQSLTPVSLAFDWTPNTNHTGIYVALAQKLYEEEGIELKILPYSDSVSPDVLVNAGQVDVGISSTESITVDAASEAPVVSIAAIIAHNTSALAVLKSSGISRPAQLEGKIYGGYGAPFEEPVISTIIKNDGGTGAFKNVTLGVEAIEALKSKRVDFAWIFLGWQGVEAKREGLPIVTFPIDAYGIPDYSTPNIITSAETLEKKKDLLKRFMRATARGYEYARTHPRESAQMLIDAVPPGTFPDTGLVFESQEYLSPRYADQGEKWGVQSPESWHDYPKFMLDNKSVFDAEGSPVTAIDFDSLYTNELLE